MIGPLGGGGSAELYRAADEMTQQYLVGELSSLLGELVVVSSDTWTVGAITQLREEAQGTPPRALGPVVERAVAVANRACRDAVAAGGITALLRALTICTALRELGVCAGYLSDASWWDGGPRWPRPAVGGDGTSARA